MCKSPLYLRLAIMPANVEHNRMEGVQKELEDIIKDAAKCGDWLEAYNSAIEAICTRGDLASQALMNYLAEKLDQKLSGWPERYAQTCETLRKLFEEPEHGPVPMLLFEHEDGALCGYHIDAKGHIHRDHGNDLRRVEAEHDVTT
jgi:hypothetical protein